MDQEQRRGDEQEGELDGLGHAAEDRGEGNGDEQGEQLLLLLGLGGGVEGKRDARATEDLRPAGTSEGGVGSELLERIGGCGDLGSAVAKAV